MSSQPIKAVFETATLDHAFSVLGLVVAAANDGEVPDIVVGWSARSRLLRKPEFAILNDAQTPYVRLPLGLNELRQRLAEVQPRSAPASVVSLSTPVGQWKNSLLSLAAITDVKDPDAFPRFSELRRFASKHWPSSYDGPLRDARHQLERSEVPVAEMELMYAQADSVAIMHAMRPLQRWASGGSEADRIRVILEGVVYVSQRLADLKMLEAHLAGDPWCQELASDVESVERALQRLDTAGVVIMSELLDTLSGIRAAAARVQTFSLDGWADHSELCVTTAKKLIKDVDSIAASSTEVTLQLRTDTKHEN